jgi:predicted dehydrogenase
VTARGGRGPSRFAIVGSGWRSAFFLRIARLMPDRFHAVGVVTRTAERGGEVQREWRVPTFRTVEALIDAGRPDFVVVAVPWEVAPTATMALVDRQVPVLTETPPAPDAQGLRDLWSAVGASGLVQVAEQYLLMPSHAARWSVLQRGTVGSVTSVQVSSTHQYHAISMIRRMLGASFSPVDVNARAYTAPLVDPLSRDGWAEHSEPRPATTTLALLDFGRGRSGVYDFTDNQWFNPLRVNRIVVRGSHGELVDDRVTRISDPHTVIESPLVRRQTGIDLNLEGFDLDHISHDGVVVYRNPYQGCRLAEDDISVAAIMDQMAAWCRGEADEPYPLADGCQDHLVALAIEESVRTGTGVRTANEPWAPGSEA